MVIVSSSERTSDARPRPREHKKLLPNLFSLLLEPLYLRRRSRGAKERTYETEPFEDFPGGLNF